MSRTIFPVKAPGLSAHADEISHCARCPKLCRHTCPVADAEGRETVTPWALMSALYMRDKGLDALSGPDSALVYHCSDCRACQGACTFHNDVPGALHAYRALAFERGDAPEGAVKMADELRDRGTLGTGGPEVIRRAVPEARRRPNARELIWMDCMTSTHFPDIAGDLETILEALDLREVGFYMGEVACCGLPLYQAGDHRGLRAHIEAVLSRIGWLRRVYVTSPECAHFMREVYPAFGFEVGVRIRPFLDLVHAHLDALPRRPASSKRYAFHQPCAVARGLGRSKEMLEVISRAIGGAPREPFLHGPRTSCSGGGGGLAAILPEVAGRVTRRCLDALALEAGETLITACSAGRHRFEEEGVEREGGIATVDWISLVAACLSEDASS